MSNQKGGCGKSTACFHLAGAFVASGRSVLLIDADPQGSLSQGFFGSQALEQAPSEATLARVLDDALPIAEASQLICRTNFEGVRIVVANQHLASFNHPQPETSGLSQYLLRDFLEQVTDVDLVLIDCPPNLYRCTWVSLVAADWMVIPVPPEDFGTQGLRAVHQAAENARLLNPKLRRLGHLISRRDSRLLVHREYEKRLRHLYPELVLETVIPEAADLKTAIAARTPIEFYKPQCQSAGMIRQLAVEVMDRIELRRPGRRQIA